MTARDPVACTIDGCVRPVEARGWCSMHYGRWWRNGDPMTVRSSRRPSPPLTDRLWSRLDRSSGDCWIWTGALNAAGYGAIGDGGKVLRVHRVVYELLVGPIPEGLQLDHLCRNRVCGNPDHLEPVTNRENWIRGENLTARTVRNDICQRGHPFSANARVRPNGSRTCRACERLAYERRKAS